MAETTTIEITKTQARELDRIANGSYKEKLQVLIESYEQSDLTKADVRSIANEQISERVVPEAQR